MTTVADLVTEEVIDRVKQEAPPREMLGFSWLEFGILDYIGRHPDQGIGETKANLIARLKENPKEILNAYGALRDIYGLIYQEYKEGGGNLSGQVLVNKVGLTQAGSATRERLLGEIAKLADRKRG